MPDAIATARLVAAVRKFSASVQPWHAALRYQTMPDERTDLTLIAYRAYGNRDEFMVIMAAAGLDSVEQVLMEQVLILPTQQQLAQIKAEIGFEDLS